MTLRLVRAASQGISDFMDPLLRPLGFAESALHTLILLFASTEGRASPGELCDTVGQTRANMTRILQTLAKQKFISRTTDRSDGRRQLISITAEGRRLIHELVPRFFGPLKQALEGMSSEEMHLLSTLTRKLIESLDQGQRQLRVLA